MHQRLLVPIDGSSTARRGLDATPMFPGSDAEQIARIVPLAHGEEEE